MSLEISSSLFGRTNDTTIKNEDVDITKHHNGTAHLCYATMMNSRLT